MFNQRKRRRRTGAPSPGQRSPRFRRLAIEAMESRLLLSGNQVSGGDFDTSIWQIPSPGSNYYVIPQGDAAGAPTTVTDNSPPQSHQLADDTGAEYHSLYDQLAITPSLDVPLVFSSITPRVITTILGNGDTNNTVESDSTGKLSNLGNLLSPRDIAYFDAVSSNDSTLDANSFEVRLRLGSKLDSLNAGASAFDWNGTNSVVGSSLANSPALAPVVKLFVVHTVDSASIGKSYTAEFVAVAPSVDLQAVDTNGAASQVEPPQDSNVGNQTVGNHVDLVQADVVAPVQEVAAILPTSQPTKEEQLSDAIDDLLSDDTIIVSPSGQSGSEFVVDGTLNDASSDLAASGEPEGGAALDAGSVEQIVDGGMIPLDVIVAVTTNNATTIASHDTQLALDETSDVVGELSRVAVMELIEGEAEPGAPQAADRVILVASGDTSDPLAVVQAMTRRAGVAIAMASPTGPAYLAKIAGAAVDAASRAMASIVGTQVATEATANVAPADDARSEAFSQLGADEDDELAAADAGSVHWNNWLAAAPLVVALACELAIASRKNRRERDSLRSPLKAK